MSKRMVLILIGLIGCQGGPQLPDDVAEIEVALTGTSPSEIRGFNLRITDTSNNITIFDREILTRISDGKATGAQTIPVVPDRTYRLDAQAVDNAGVAIGQGEATVNATRGQRVRVPIVINLNPNPGLSTVQPTITANNPALVDATSVDGLSLPGGTVTLRIDSYEDWDNDPMTTGFLFRDAAMRSSARLQTSSASFTLPSTPGVFEVHAYAVDRYGMGTAHEWRFDTVAGVSEPVDAYSLDEFQGAPGAPKIVVEKGNGKLKVWVNGELVYEASNVTIISDNNSGNPRTIRYRDNATGTIIEVQIDKVTGAVTDAVIK